jgi:acetyl-CoA acyltransferase
MSSPRPVLAALIDRTSIDPKELDDVRLGCAMPEAEQGMNVARIAQFLAKIPESVPACTINRFCASGLGVGRQRACYQIAYGDADLIIAGGVESMSMVPMAATPRAPTPRSLTSTPKSIRRWGSPPRMSLRNIRSLARTKTSSPMSHT